MLFTMRKCGFGKPFNLITILLVAILSVVIVGCTSSDGGTSPTPTQTVTHAPTQTPAPTPTSTPPEEVPPAYEVVASERNNLWWRRTTDCSVTLKNTGDMGGYFRVEFNLITDMGKGVTKVVWQALEPDEQKEVTVRYDKGYVDAFTYSITPPALTPAPTPAPTAAIETWNVSRKLSGLTYTLTTVHWTGNEIMAEWVIENNTGQTVDRSRLDTILTLGIVAVDQAGNEGEYFIPEPFKRNLNNGDIKSYETRWIFYPESDVITVHLRDLYSDGQAYVDANVEFVFTR